jgi:hypothetical protein
MGCAKDYVTSSQGDVQLFINSINEGAALESDVSSAGAAQRDVVPVSLALRVKNPLNTVTPQVALAVRVERYEVRYLRTDGHNAEGIDVPYAFAGATAFTLDVGDNADLALEIVRAAAKQEPPLRNLRDGGGLSILTCIAEVTVHGRQTSGEAVTAQGRLMINFADFPDSQ